MLTEIEVLANLPITGDDQEFKKAIKRAIVALGRQQEVIIRLVEGNR